MRRNTMRSWQETHQQAKRASELEGKVILHREDKRVRERGRGGGEKEIIMASVINEYD